MFVGKGKGENSILKEFVWRIIFKIFFPKYLVVRRTTRSQFLVVLTQFLVVEDTRTRKFCYPVTVLASRDSTCRVACLCLSSPIVLGRPVLVTGSHWPVPAITGQLPLSLRPAAGSQIRDLILGRRCTQH